MLRTPPKSPERLTDEQARDADELAQTEKECAAELRNDDRMDRSESPESYYGVSGLFKGSHL